MFHTIAFGVVGLVAATLMMIAALSAIAVAIFIVAGVGNIFSRAAHAAGSVGKPPH